MESMTRHLANRVANIKFEDLPQETIQMTKQYILDYLGVSIRGWTQKNMDIMSETLGNSADGTKAIMLMVKKVLRTLCFTQRCLMPLLLILRILTICIIRQLFTWLA